MQYAHNTYLKCSYCDNHFTKYNLLAGNTFVTNLYSDGFRIIPMWLTPVELELCNECDNFNWTRLLIEIDKLPPFAKVQEQKDFDLYTWEKAIEAGVYGAGEQEFYLRTGLWWAFNDRVRNGNPLFEKTDEEISWGKNLHALLNILNNKIPEHHILEIEIQRNFGNFNEAMKLLKTLPHNFKNIAAQFEYQILAQNKAVFQLEL